MPLPFRVGVQARGFASRAFARFALVDCEEAGRRGDGNLRRPQGSSFVPMASGAKGNPLVFIMPGAARGLTV